MYNEVFPTDVPAKMTNVLLLGRRLNEANASPLAHLDCRTKEGALHSGSKTVRRTDRRTGKGVTGDRMK